MLMPLRQKVMAVPGTDAKSPEPARKCSRTQRASGVKKSPADGPKKARRTIGQANVGPYCNTHRQPPATMDFMALAKRGLRWATVAFLRRLPGMGTIDSAKRIEAASGDTVRPVIKMAERVSRRFT